MNTNVKKEVKQIGLTQKQIKKFFIKELKKRLEFNHLSPKFNMRLQTKKEIFDENCYITTAAKSIRTVCINRVNYVLTFYIKTAN